MRKFRSGLPEKLLFMPSVFESQLTDGPTSVCFSSVNNQYPQLPSFNCSFDSGREPQRLTPYLCQNTQLKFLSRQPDVQIYIMRNEYESRKFVRIP